MNYIHTFHKPFIIGFRVVSASPRRESDDIRRMVGWEHISEQRISNDGKWVFCKMEPWRGDASIQLYNGKGEEKAAFKPASTAQFSASSQYLLVTKVPSLEMVEAEKLKKTDKDKMPMEQPCHLPTDRRRRNRVDSLKTLQTFRNG